MWSFLFPQADMLTMMLTNFLPELANARDTVDQSKKQANHRSKSYDTNCLASSSIPMAQVNGVEQVPSLPLSKASKRAGR
jgi:hypothetical protein